MKKGFFGIGCMGMKTRENYGTLFRSAQIFGADFVFLIGSRFKKQASDTCSSWKNIPTFEYKSFDDFNDHRPYSSQLIGVELMDSASPIKNFVHPRQACYLLGAEDHGLTQEAIDNCQHIVYIPGEISLNVAVAGSIVLFDRINKLNEK